MTRGRPLNKGKNKSSDSSSSSDSPDSTDTSDDSDNDDPLQILKEDTRTRMLRRRMRDAEAKICQLERSLGKAKHRIRELEHVLLND
jgi:hypothetical protein